MTGRLMQSYTLDELREFASYNLCASTEQFLRWLETREQQLWTELKICPECEGYGMVQTPNWHGAPGTQPDSVPCRACNGSGDAS